MFKQLLCIFLILSTVVGVTIPLNKDSKGEQKARQGDIIEIRLDAYDEQGQHWVWSAPKHSGARVLNQLSSSSDPNGNAFARFEVEGPGKEDITSQRVCKKSPNCPKVAGNWKVTIDAA
ncbi:uncharacterized protein VTP21DRAFT_7759 [Calcarisporiella thermophila]|uniref:uncharacterized protein n=1 Tax=Calcarisporiella thermophila TaxID=911321 RepID=UPI003742AA8B